MILVLCSNTLICAPEAGNAKFSRGRMPPCSPYMLVSTFSPWEVRFRSALFILRLLLRFLDRCHKRHFTSQTVSIFNLLEQQDKSAFKRAIYNHMLGAIIPNKKELVYNLCRKRCHLPQIKTERYKKTFVNRLIFEYNLV